MKTRSILQAFEIREEIDERRRRRCSLVPNDDHPLTWRTWTPDEMRQIACSPLLPLEGHPLLNGRNIHLSCRITRTTAKGEGVTNSSSRWKSNSVLIVYTRLHFSLKSLAPASAADSLFFLIILMTGSFAGSEVTLPSMSVSSRAVF